MSHSSRRSRDRRWATSAAPLLACAGLVTGGCARLPHTGVKVSGEPLTVDFRTEQRAYVGQKKVGEVVNKDAAGRVIGTSEVYEDKLVHYNVEFWQVFQGNDRIDDQDFFRIAGDNQAADQIESGRKSGVALNTTGLVILGVGAAALAGGLIASISLKDEDRNGLDISPAWPNYVITGGLVTALVGGSLAWYGAAKVKREHPFDDPRRAKRVADKYNASLSSAGEATSEEAKPRKKKKKPVFNEAEEE